MAIVLFVSDEYGGYGDFLFGLKTVAGLKESLKILGYLDPIYLVTGQNGKKIILALGGDREFDVEVKTTEEFSYLQKSPDFTFDYYIEGPIFHPFSHDQIIIPEDTSVLLLPEYSDNERAELVKIRLANYKRQQLDIIHSGFYLNDQVQKNSGGLLLTPNLMKVAEEKERGDFNFRKVYWDHLEKYSTRICGLQAEEVYHETTDLFFEYSHDTRDDKSIYHRNQCEHYLQMHHLFVAESTKNQDIISVGKNEKSKILAVQNTLFTLIESGFNKILYISLDTDKKQVLYDQSDKKAAGKTYRFFYTKQLTHPEMIAALALSGDLVGVTGDQSLGEALSAKKLIVYECLSHKKELVEGLIRFFELASKNHNTKKLVELLIRINIDDPRDNKKNELKKLLSDPTIPSDYQMVCQNIHQDSDLLKPIKLSIEPIISHIVAQNTKLGHTTLALLGLKAEQITRYQEILKNNSSDPQKILKISRKDKRLLSHNLPFSVLKYPENKGFYLLTSGKGSVLGQGGWGKVKLGHYCDSRGIVSQHALAIKVEKIAANPISEIGLFKAAHPRQGDYFYRQGFALDNKKNYSIFPKLPGMPLGAYLENNSDLTMRERLLISLAVLRAVLELHQKGIAHLDLKPENILYDPDSTEYQAYLIDFGYSEKFDTKIVCNSLNDARFTIEYMPPEYFENSCVVDENLDIYSLGMILSQIVGIPLVDLIKEKVQEAIEAFQNKKIQAEILKIFDAANSLDAVLLQLPDNIHKDINFNAFIKKFSYSNKVNFSFCGIDDLVAVLQQMVDSNPRNRPSMMEVAISLAKIVESVDNNPSGIMYPSR